MIHRTVLVLLVVLSLALTGLAVAADITASGTQIRGNPGKNAELKAKPFTLKKDSAIAAAQDGGAGFWIDKQGGGMVKSFDTAKSAVGFKLKAGTYSAYPNLKPGQNSATVTLTFRN